MNSSMAPYHVYLTDVSERCALGVAQRMQKSDIILTELELMTLFLDCHG